MAEQLWGGRFSKSTDEMINDFQASIDFDKRMYNEDIAGSIAHATMLAKVGIISETDRDDIIKGLKDIYKKIEEGNFSFEVALEDIHMNIEKRLTDAIGEAGGRLHTARSRNDQVALDTHMFIDVFLPGYTHLQRAQPILFSHHMMAYFSMLKRDFDRFRGVYERCDIMPLGAGALAGTTFPIDRPFVAEQLNFDAIFSNSLDAVSDRVMGHLMAMLTTVKGLPLAYNKDLQEDKEGIFDAIDTIKFSLAVYARILRGMKVRKDVMRRAVAEDFSNATDLADYLVKKGMPFRQAHAVSGKAVHYCIEQGKWLADMSMEEFQKLSDLFAEDIYEAISPETCVKNRNSYGGTSYQQVEMQLQLADKLLEAEQGYITEKDAKQAKVQL